MAWGRGDFGGKFEWKDKEGDRGGMEVERGKMRSGAFGAEE